MSHLPFAGSGTAPPARFERECGFTVADWRRCLPEAVAPAVLQWLPDADQPPPREVGGDGEEGAVVDLGSGRLRLRWQVLPERRIALVRLPRLAVQFAFDGCSADERRAFLHRFDRVMQRGGG